MRRKTHGKGGPRARPVALNFVAPYDFSLSLRLTRSFVPSLTQPGERMRFAARVGGRPTVIEIRCGARTMTRLEAVSMPKADPRLVRRLGEWVLNADLDLAPFYRLASKDRRLAPIVRRFKGLKPIRPASLFEMAVIAITEQQISMAAATKIRSRLVEKLGKRVGDLWVFPEPAVLAKASSRTLLACGLSHAKTRYIRELAAKVASRELRLDALKTMPDAEARERIMGLKGFGPWSADYILIRGLARPDAVPVDDLGVRSVVGESLGRGERIAASEVTRLLEPLRPFRGLVVFYLFADNRLPDRPELSRTGP